MLLLFLLSLCSSETPYKQDHIDVLSTYAWYAGRPYFVLIRHISFMMFVQERVYILDKTQDEYLISTVNYTRSILGKSVWKAQVKRHIWLFTL